MVTPELLIELSLWYNRLIEKAEMEGLERMEQADLDFLNDRLPRFNTERRVRHHE